ncbi:hypothetical protein [Swaminathania salitolerans]|uniref:Uncharacterized protein n=1 Tax=Swaminathania salitolerans TaxID=182838 RepID=A0A511BL30_9PROT|nr:hypothetical protein [Swaminathania salitolerans]GEL01047.1 hypothetical protein SSA02_02100 [Swaminathania salitolerans]
MVDPFTRATTRRPVSAFLSTYQLTGDLPQALIAAALPVLSTLLNRTREGNAHV